MKLLPYQSKVSLSHYVSPMSSQDPCGASEDALVAEHLFKYVVAAGKKQTVLHANCTDTGKVTWCESPVPTTGRPTRTAEPS